MGQRDEGMLPGQDLIEAGLADLAADRLSEPALLVLVAGPRLRKLGIAVPRRTTDRPWEHQLYEALEARLGNGAHSQYNALIRRIVSYARAYERGKQEMGSVTVKKPSNGRGKA